MPTMNRARTAMAVLLIAAAGACRDAPTDPADDELKLELRQAGVPFEETTIQQGTSVQLTATFLNAAGTPRNGGAVSWSSTDDAVATVDGNGRVTAISVGTAKIIAESGAQADSGLVNVAVPVTAELVCAPSDPGLALAVGDVRHFAGAETTNLCLPGGLQGSEYLVVGFNSSLAAGAQLDARIVASNPTLALSLSASAAPVQPFTRLREGPARDEQFHLRHLRQSHAMLSPVAAGRPSRSISARAVPAMGELLRLNAATPAESACSSPDYRTGRVVAISQRAIIVADTTNPANGFSASNYQTIGQVFDDLIWQQSTTQFGEPTDIDENDRVIIFYTRAVNELTPPNSDSYVGGFHYNRDLFPRQGTNACGGSNESEMFYMLVPDPNGEVNGNQRSTAFVLDRTFSVLAHEFQHLINDSRRLYVNDAEVWEEDWLNEGLSHVAEELTFYAAAGLAPRQNIGSTALTGGSVQHFYRYNVDNMERYIRYLRDPDANSLMGNVDQLGTRGAIWAFLRYMADREPGDDSSLWRNLVNSRTMGLANLEEVLGVDPREWMRDWQVAVYTDDAGIPVSDEYLQPSWNYRAITTSLDTSGRFPLQTSTLSPTSPSILLEGGAAVFFRMNLAAGTERAVRATVGELPPPSRLRLSVVRLR